jgi:hypothetical protein
MAVDFDLAGRDQCFAGAAAIAYANQLPLIPI